MAYNYVKGDDKAVTDLYGDRTANSSCAYFTRYVAKTAKILDVGCGPGRITADLAQLAPDGHTTGIDNSEGIIDQAKASFPPSSNPNVTFAVGDANNLSQFADDTFDIVHAHQLLVHMTDPVAVFKEFYRICKPGGFLASRESNPSVLLALNPDLPSIREYWDRTKVVMKKMSSNPDAGSKIEAWAKEAGFGVDGGEILASKSRMSMPGHLGMVTGEKAEQAIKYGMATKEEMDMWAAGWEEWERAGEDKQFMLECGEIICWKGT